MHTTNSEIKKKIIQTPSKYIRSCTLVIAEVMSSTHEVRVLEEKTIVIKSIMILRIKVHFNILTVFIFPKVQLEKHFPVEL